jgi:hypothetical protein
MPTLPAPDVRLIRSLHERYESVETAARRPGDQYRVATQRAEQETSRTIEIHRLEGAWKVASSDLSTPVDKCVERGEIPANPGILLGTISPAAGVEEAGEALL